MSYDKTDFRNGIHETFVPVAFGTGIGNRKITVNPEYRWNKMNVSNPPKWFNGNWADSTLGGESVSLWDKYHSVYKKKNSKENKNGKSNNNSDSNDSMNKSGYDSDEEEKTIENIIDNNDNYMYDNISKIDISNYNGKLNENSNQVMGVSEGFQNSEVFENEDCNTCKKFEWNWIVLVLILIVLMMSIIIYNVI